MTTERKRLKLVSLNIEMDRHLDAVLSFLEREHPDVVCFQELLERDVERFEQTLGFRGRFEPMAALKSPLFEKELQGLPFGLALFSRYPAEYATHYYAGIRAALPDCVMGYEGNKFLLTGLLRAHGASYRVGTTHFTWTPDGQASEGQRRDLAALFGVLGAFPDIFFCGDFNAPRGREIWRRLALRYHDNIPPEYESSIDPALHRAKGLQVMVDGLFSTPEYAVSDVRLVEGVSDHSAIVGHIERVG